MAAVAAVGWLLWGLLSARQFTVMMGCTLFVAGNTAWLWHQGNTTKKKLTLAEEDLKALKERHAFAKPFGTEGAGGSPLLASVAQPELKLLLVRGDERGFHRVLVKNLTGKAVQIGAKLVRMVPAEPRARIPMPLQLTHAPGKDTVHVEAGGEQEVDVFRLLEPTSGVIFIPGVAYSTDVLKQKYTFRVSAFCVGGASVERTFEFDPVGRQVFFEAVDD